MTTANTSPSMPAQRHQSHPNEMDLRRIARALEGRRRYRYVSPSVRPVAGGYHIEAPCCSRNIDPDGGVVDIALLQHLPAIKAWQLEARDHAAGAWRPQGTYRRLAEALDLLCADPERQFWR